MRSPCAPARHRAHRAVARMRYADSTAARAAGSAAATSAATVATGASSSTSGLGSREQVEQRGGCPAMVDDALEAGAVTRASLADAHQLGGQPVIRPGEHHLARGHAVEAHQSRPRRGVHRPGVHHGAGHADPFERVHEAATQPAHRRRHVDRDERRRCRDDHVEPRHLPRPHEHRPATTAAPHDLHPGGGGALVVDHPQRLRRSEHHRRDRRLAHDDRRDAQ